MAEKRASIRDVASKAGLSPSLVSRILNRRPTAKSIPESTRKWVDECAAALKYTPNINAKRLFSRRSNVIALVLPSFENRLECIFYNHHLAEFFAGLEPALAAVHYRLMLIFNDTNFVAEKEYLSLFRSHAVDGMLVWGACDGENYWSELADEHVPLLFLTSHTVPGCEFNYVDHDYRTAGRLAAGELLRQGCRRLGWIGGTAGHAVTREMEEGIRCELEAAGGELIPEYGNYQPEQAVACALRLLQVRPAIDGLLISNARPAQALLMRLRAAGIEAPPIAACDSCPPDVEENLLPRVIMDDRTLAVRGVEALVRMIEDNTYRIAWHCPVRLIS